jgi:two-component system sensor histidine kinase/response regulator
VFQVGAGVPARLVGDPLRVGQVLLNYANNAVKFTERGSVIVGVERLPGGDGAVHLRFSVRDTGIGMTAEQAGRMFQSFTQAESSITRRFGGTGLGLAISKRLAELVGGEVGVESAPGQGSTFWFTAVLQPAPESPPVFGTAPELRQRRALVVDDNDAARTVVAQMLRGMGLEVSEAASGSAALQELPRAAAAGSPYDIVYVDWLMPGLDGVETARRIRELSAGSGVLVLMVTAYARAEAVRQAREADIAAVLSKPINPSALLDATLQALGRGRVDGDAPATRAAPSALQGARVLLVEDNEINRLVATELLRRHGVDVQVAVDGAQALDIAPFGGFDLVLMDMQMPVMDGLTATRELRKDPALRELPILAMTANATEGDRQDCLAAGMNDFVTKPVDPQRLRDALLRWIRPREAAHEGAPATAAKPAPESALPIGIEGLDTALGLRFALNREPLYLDLLARFVQRHEKLPQQVQQAWLTGRREEAERLAHTLVGSAGQLGAVRVQESARELEDALHQPRPDPALVHQRLARLDHVLTTLLARLREQL